MSYGLDRNSIGFSRRAVYADGSAKMYGNTNQPDFVNLEGMDDDDVGSIFFYDRARQPEGDHRQRGLPFSGGRKPIQSINADFWLPVRDNLKARYGDRDCRAGLGRCGRGHVSPSAAAQGRQRAHARSARHQ